MGVAGVTFLTEVCSLLWVGLEVGVAFSSTCMWPSMAIGSEATAQVKGLWAELRWDCKWTSGLELDWKRI